MKKKSASRSGFFNLRVLILLCAGVFVALFATAATEWTRRSDSNPSGVGFGAIAARPAQTKPSVSSVAGWPDWSQPITDPVGQLLARVNRPNRTSVTPADAVQQAWVARYNGPGNLEDRASAITVDASGNVYVTGTSAGSDLSADFATIKYDASGQEQWVARHDGAAAAIAVDGSGNVYVTGYSGVDYVTIKYDASGQQQWVVPYDGPAQGVDSAIGIAVDGSGNVYVTGYSGGSGTSDDWATVKYDGSGQQQWVVRYDGPAHANDQPSAIAIDQSGNVYVTGHATYDLATSYDYTTIKYNSSGEEQWVASYDGPAGSQDEARAIAVDASGNAYVTGFSQGIGTDLDVATIKYDESGQRQWVVRYDDEGHAGDVGLAIAVDGSGNVYVTGGRGVHVPPPLEGFLVHYGTIKYDASGQPQWVASYEGPEHGNDVATAIALDSSDNVYVTGRSSYWNGANFIYSYATIKYTAAEGSEEWIARYDGPPGLADDYPTGMAVDFQGNVYVTGASSNVSYDYATIKYCQSSCPTPTPTPCGTDDWREKAPLPYRARGAFVVSDSRFVYVGGGYDGWDVHTDLLRYDPEADTWTTLSPSPDYHYLSQAVIFNNKIYNIGGFHYAGQSNVTRIYDIATNTWTTGAPMPAPNGLSDMATALWDAKIYIAGGYDGVGAVDTLYIYDIASDSWTIGLSMPQAVFLPGFGVINGKLYVASGNDGATEQSVLQIYDIATNTWSTGSNAPMPVTGPGSNVYNGELWLFGGGAPVTVTQIYNPGTNSWHSGTDMNVARVRFYGAAVGDSSILAPGGDNPGSPLPLNTNEVFSAPCGTPMPTATPSATPTPTTTPTPTGTPRPTPIPRSSPAPRIRPTPAPRP